MRIIYFLATVLFLTISTTLCAQIQHVGQPNNWENRFENLPELNLVQMPEIDLERLQEEDLILDQQKDIPFRFGENILVDIDIHNSGNWEILEDGSRIWRVAIQSPGATTINFIFDQYIIPEDARVFVYPADRSYFIGAFNSQNTSPENSLGVGVVKGDEIIIEYYEPAEVAGEGYLHINNVTHGYRSALGVLEKRGEFGDSGPCNININCPEGLPYQDIKRSVAAIIVNGNGHCTGALVNNTAQDQTPYFLTANHCLIGNLNNMTFYFNYENLACEGNIGPIDQSISGATLKSSNADSDFALLELNTSVPESYNPVFAGWDNSDSEETIAFAFGIHHPRGDVKKICFEDDVPFHDIRNFEGNADTHVWHIDQWELGVTEPASSGSPLFNQNQQIIGQLAGGQAACSGTVNNGQFDFYGRFGISWTGNNSGSSNSRLQDWLDPSNSGLTSLGPFPPLNMFDNDITLIGLADFPNVDCEDSPIFASIGIFNSGSETITEFEMEYVLNNGSPQTFEFNGNIESGEFTTIPIDALPVVNGENNITAEISTVNGELDESEFGNSFSKQFFRYANGADFEVYIDHDDWPEETSWRIETLEGDVVYQHGTYSETTTESLEELCLGVGCYNFIILDDAEDGICCEYGMGSYEVRQGENILASGGEFGAEEVSEFCIEPTSIMEYNALEDLMFFPNPTNGILNIDWGANEINSATLSISDNLGRTLIQKKINSGTRNLNLEGFSDGLYILTIESEEGLTSRKIILQK